jgi:hypothetical protein
MKFFVDGDQLCVVPDDFVNLQESPAVFVPLGSPTAKTIQEDGVRGLPVGELRRIYESLHPPSWQDHPLGH